MTIARRRSRPTPELPPTTRTSVAVGEALLAVALASVLSWVLRDHLGSTRLLLFWVASAYTAWRGGFWPTVVASGIGLVMADFVADFVTVRPSAAFSRPTPNETVLAVVFLLVTGVLGATFDRLRRTRAEALTAAHQLEQAVERYRALVEASSVVVWTTDPAGAVHDMPAWRELTGQSVDEVRGLGWLDAIHSAERETVRSGWQAAVAAGRAYDMEFRLHLRDGTHRWFRARAVPIRHGAHVVEWVGVFDDTHEAHVDAERRAAVENALGVLGASLDYEWTLAALTRLVVPALADYCTVDLVDRDGSIRRVSTTHVDPEKEALLRDLVQRYPQKPTDRVGVPEVLRTGEPQLTVDIDPEATRAFARDTGYAEALAILAPRSYLCIPMSAREHTFGALSLVYSDSGRRYDEADFNAAQEIAMRAATAIDNARLYAAAQAANRAKSDFLATMSHELRTPLNAIAGYAELLALGVRGPVNEEQLRDLSRIRQNQQHLLEIITDILNFSRLEADRVRYALAPVPVRDMLARMEGMIEPQARARSIAYHCDPGDDDLLVLADREKLEQVLINLLSNAVKFTPSGGRITLSAAAEGERVALRVHDTGVGIDPSHLASIFEPFVQLEPALTRTTEGTGLGLAISRELTRGMGGELSVTSTPGEGSTFVVALPHVSARNQLVG